VNLTWRQMDRSIVDSHLVPEVCTAEHYVTHKSFRDTSGVVVSATIFLSKVEEPSSSASLSCDLGA
jgi:hypothetical protein